MIAAGFVSPHGELLLLLWRVRPHIDSSSDQVLKIYLSLTEKKRQRCADDETKHVYLSFFNPLKVTGELEIEILG